MKDWMIDFNGNIFKINDYLQRADKSSNDGKQKKN